MKRFMAGFVLGALLSPVVIVVGLLGYSWLLSDSGDAALKAPVLPSTPANFDWTLTDYQTGEPMSLSEFRGKTIVLTVWNPTCGSCKLELPHLQNLYERIADDKNVAFMAVAVSNEDKRPEIIQDYDLTMPIYTFEGDQPAEYSMGGVPSTFIIAPDGTFAVRYKGAARWDDETAVRYLKGLQAGTPILEEVTPDEGD